MLFQRYQNSIFFLIFIIAIYSEFNKNLKKRFTLLNLCSFFKISFKIIEANNQIYVHIALRYKFLSKIVFNNKHFSQIILILYIIILSINKL